MTNEEFQKVIIEKLAENDKFQKVVIEKFSENDKFQKVVIEKLEENDKFQKVVIEKFTENDKFQKAALQEFKEIKNKIGNMETRQDEIFQVVRAIEHNNQVGRSELDSQNIRVAKLEGKFKKVGKVCIEDDLVSNL